MRKNPILPDTIHHIYNRGVNRGNIFFNNGHWLFFLHRLTEYFIPEKADLLAYCLMPNHYHLLVHIKTDDFGNEVMMPFTVSYTRAVNRQMKRVGPIFQGTYQTRQADSLDTIIHISRYIHLNPVKADLVDQPEDWMFSSYRDYIGLRNGRLPKKEMILSDFISSDEYRTYTMSEWDMDKFKNCGVHAKVVEKMGERRANCYDKVLTQHRNRRLT